MVHVDFSIFYTGGSYGHASGYLDTERPAAPGATLNLTKLVSLPAPPFFSGEIVVDSIIQVEGSADVQACADVYVASAEEAQLLGRWLDNLPGLAVWPNELGNLWWDDCV